VHIFIYAQLVLTLATCFAFSQQLDTELMHIRGEMAVQCCTRWITAFKYGYLSLTHFLG